MENQNKPEAEGLETLDVIDPVQIYRRQRQEELQQRRNQRIFPAVIPMRLRQPHHMPHGKIHQNHKEHR